jgi:hypothetical protein
MEARYVPQFNDGSGVPVISTHTYDTPGEADTAGAELDVAGLRYVGYVRRARHADLVRLSGALRIGPVEVGGNRWAGIVTRWREGDPFGFITDTEQRSWFVSCEDVPGRMLGVGTRVTFAGSPSPPPGKKYPQARTIMVQADAG